MLNRARLNLCKSTALPLVRNPQNTNIFPRVPNQEMLYLQEWDWKDQIQINTDSTLDSQILQNVLVMQNMSHHTLYTIYLIMHGVIGPMFQKG